MALGMASAWTSQIEPPNRDWKFRDFAQPPGIAQQLAKP